MRTLSVACLTCVVIAACGAQHSRDKLRETVTRFNEGVRWGRLQDVMPHLYSENAKHFMEMHKEFGKDIQVSEIEIINWIPDPEKKKWDVNVQITWYRLSQMVVHTTLLVQHWEKQGQGWMLIAEEIKSGEPF